MCSCPQTNCFIAITLLMVNTHIPYASFRLFEVLDHWWRYNEIQIYNVSFNKYRPYHKTRKQKLEVCKWCSLNCFSFFFIFPSRWQFYLFVFLRWWWVLSSILSTVSYDILWWVTYISVYFLLFDGVNTKIGSKNIRSTYTVNHYFPLR